MMVTDWILWIGGGAGAVFGTGGVGYALVQAFIKRGDKGEQANVAKILTGVASDMVVDLRRDKQAIEKERDYYRRELRNLKRAVDPLLDDVDQVIAENAILQVDTVITMSLKENLNKVKDKMY
jgi:hypothetical protein